MNQDIDALMHNYLDGTLSEEEQSVLNELIKASPENTAAFVQTVQLHDQLRDLIRVKQAVEPAHRSIQTNDVRRTRRSTRIWKRVGIAGGLVTLAASVLIFLWWKTPSQATAADELNFLIEKASTPGDRTYLIRNLDTQAERTDDRQPPIEGALLHVRAPDKYVLVRRFPDGREFVTGSDGEHGWSIPPAGKVRLSNDPLRFRGPVPGHQHGIPFVDLRSDLMQLRDAYHITLIGTDANGKQGLRADKKSTSYRGPNQVELRFDRASGIVYRMIFDGMPRARGGPNRVSVDLVDQAPLDLHFFSYESHLRGNREIVWED